MKSDVLYLGHILNAISKIEDYISSSNYETFKNNNMMVDAVVRELEIIGEASNNLSEEFKRKNPEMPLRDAIDMRNFFAHEYFGVNTKVVWDTCKDDLIKLRKFVEERLQKL